LRSARYAALAVIDPASGFPTVSRVLLGIDADGVPVILVSELSAHTKALAKDPRASLLAGEPGKGDPLAHPRLGVECVAEPVQRGTPQHRRIRDRFLARHPKSKLYIDFADFRFLRLRPQAASLNGGFGRAYRLEGEDLMIRSEPDNATGGKALAIVQDLLGSFPSLATDLATAINPGNKQHWRIYGLDMAGFDLISGEKLLRYEFEKPLNHLDDIQSRLAKIANPVP
jgi:putative heme iron utilization protein